MKLGQLWRSAEAVVLFDERKFPPDKRSLAQFRSRGWLSATHHVPFEEKEQCQNMSRAGNQDMRIARRWDRNPCARASGFLTVGVVPLSNITC